MKHRNVRRHRLGTLFTAAAFAAVGILLPAPTAAVQPQQWVHQSPADFNSGKLDNAVVTSFGELRPAAQSRDIGALPDELTVIHAAKAIGNELFIAAGPKTTLLKRAGEELQTLLSLDHEQVFWLGEWDGSLLVAVSGEGTSRLAVLDGEELRDVVNLPEDVRYVWDVAVHGRQLFLATGTEGRVLQVNPEAREEEDRIQVILDAPQNNILRLAVDRNGRVFAGTDTDGLVYRITLARAGDPTVFVMFDAPEPEIGALIAMPDGTIYVGTADASQARPGSMLRPRDGDEGRAEPVADAPPEGEPAPEPMPDAEPEDGAAPADPDQAPAVDEQAAPEAPDAPEAPEGDAPEASDNADAAPNGNDEPAAGEGDPPADPEAGAEAEPQSVPSVNGRNVAAQLKLRHQLAGDLPTAVVRPMNTNAAQVTPTAAPEAAPPPPTAPAAPATDAAPTPAQRDALRAEIRRRLDAARATGAVVVQPQQAAGDAPQAARPGSTPTRPSQPTAQRPRGQGNAIYKISPEGFVTEIFRDSVMILNIMPHDGDLIVATGNDGHLFRINRDEEEHTTLISLSSQQIQAVATGRRDGREVLLLGASNPARLVELNRNPADRGTFTSPVMDASQISLWGVMHVSGRMPEGTVVEVQARSGNVSDPEMGTWSDWTGAVALARDPEIDLLAPREVRFAGDQLPPARFFQYRLHLTSQGEQSASVGNVAMNYIVPNMRPTVASLKAEFVQAPRQGPARPGQQAGQPEPTSNLRIQWQAADPNKDRLSFTLQHRLSGTDRWLTLADGLTDANFVWDTRRVPDGRYQLRLIASDAPDNPPGMELTAARISDVVVIDNTPPVIERPRIRITPPRVVMHVQVTDELSGPAAFHYTVNDSDTWIPALPDDLIFDSTSETVVVTIPDLSPGTHVVTLRASDRQGNTTFRAVNLTMPARGER